MAYNKPRILNDNRDMLLSLLPLVLICIVLAAIASQCSFSPGRPTQGPIPSFDINDALKSDAQSLNFPIRNPDVPSGWKSNSGSKAVVTGKSGGNATTVGYITPDGRYMQMTQSNASEESLVPFAAGGNRSATGTQELDGWTWVVYADQGSERVWVVNFGTVRVLILGAGTADEFAQLAHAIDIATPLKSGVPG